MRGLAGARGERTEQGAVEVGGGGGACGGGEPDAAREEDEEGVRGGGDEVPAQQVEREQLEREGDAHGEAVGDVDGVAAHLGELGGEQQARGGERLGARQRRARQRQQAVQVGRRERGRGGVQRQRGRLREQPRDQQAAHGRARRAAQRGGWTQMREALAREVVAVQGLQVLVGGDAAVVASRVLQAPHGCREGMMGGREGGRRRWWWVRVEGGGDGFGQEEFRMGGCCGWGDGGWCRVVPGK